MIAGTTFGGRGTEPGVHEPPVLYERHHHLPEREPSLSRSTSAAPRSKRSA